MCLPEGSQTKSGNRIVMARALGSEQQKAILFYLNWKGLYQKDLGEFTK